MKWTDIPASVVLAAADICDGHTIFKPEAFLEVGVPQELVDRCSRVYESNPADYKETIFGPDGKPVNQMAGIYGLDALASMIRDFNITAADKMGRGFQAQVWKDALHAYLSPEKEKADT